MRQISKIYLTPNGEFSNNFNFLKKFEIRTERPTKKKPTHLSGFLFIQELSSSQQIHHCKNRKVEYFLTLLYFFLTYQLC